LRRVPGTIKALPAKWFRACGSLEFNIGGQSHYLYLADKKELPTPYTDHCGLLGVLEGKIGENVLAFVKEKEKAPEDKPNAEAK
jgi:hypothetical protein